MEEDFMDYDLRQIEAAKTWPLEDLESITSCPVCYAKERSELYTGLTDRVFFCAPGSWTLYRCRVCRSAYLDPRPNSQSIQRAYNNYFTHEKPEETNLAGQLLFGKSRLAFRNGYLNFVYGYNLKPSWYIGYFLSLLLPLQRARESRAIRYLRKISPSPKLLDVGCGNGFFLKKMGKMGWQVYGIEPDEQAVKVARISGLSVEQGFLSDETFTNNFFDAVTLNHVIEHLHEPLQTLLNCYKVLKPGGIFFIATPNLDASGGKIFGRQRLSLDPPRHLVLFNHNSLNKLVKQAGFEIISNPSGFIANDFCYKASYAIQTGSKNPLLQHPKLPLALRLRCKLENLLGWVNPRLSEELVVLARKPVK